MTTIQKIFEVLSNMNQNDSIDWLLNNRHNLIQDEKEQIVDAYMYAFPKTLEAIAEAEEYYNEKYQAK